MDASRRVLPTQAMQLLHNIRQIVQIVDDGRKYLAGKNMGNIKVLECHECKLALLMNGETIEKLGTFEELRNQASELVDCRGGCVLPGLIDAHTHPVFAGDRVHEFAMKLAGATYMEVQAAGGGIHFTTQRTRQADPSHLLNDFADIANRMLASGSTTIEAKSGYGLDTETELKMLNVLDQASDTLSIEISATFCGAHAVPKGSTEKEQTELIVNEMIPKLVEIRTNGGLKSLENIDVFCEKNVFELESTEKILKKGTEAGLAINIHADELHPLQGSQLAAKLNEIDEAGVGALAESGTVAVLLPSTCYILRLRPPPARAMIDKGCILALGSDFNPNAHCLSLPMIMHLACVTFRLSMPEALVACTLNAAHSIGRGHSHGAITPGRFADLIVIAAPSWEHVIYQFGSHHSLIRFVFKKGKLVAGFECRP